MTTGSIGNIRTGLGPTGFTEDFQFTNTHVACGCGTTTLVGPHFTLVGDNTPVIAMQQAEGGVVRLQTGTTSGNRTQLTSGRHYRVESGPIVLEGILTPATDICAKGVFFGLTDLQTVEMPIESACGSDAITTNASDAVGFLYDTIGTTDRWKLVGVDSDTDATIQTVAAACGGTPVADTFQALKIELHVCDENCCSSRARFFINGVQVGNVMTSAVSANVNLTPTVAIEARENAANLLDVDLIQITASRDVAV